MEYNMILKFLVVVYVLQGFCLCNIGNVTIIFDGDHATTKAVDSDRFHTIAGAIPTTTESRYIKTSNEISTQKDIHAYTTTTGIISYNKNILTAENLKPSTKAINVDVTTHIATTRNTQVDDRCKKYGTCSVVSRLQRKFCNCDKECESYNDCCIDKIKQSATYVPLAAYIGCHSISSEEFDGFMAVGKCPDINKDHNTSHNCQKEHNLSARYFPVIDNNNILFKNKFCALCHGSDNVTHFKIKFEADPSYLDVKTLMLMTEDKQLDYLMKENISYKFIPPNGISIRHCTTQLVTSASGLCTDFINPIMGIKQNKKYILYRNSVCPQLDYTADMCVGLRYDSLFKSFGAFSLNILFAADVIDSEVQEPDKRTATEDFCVSTATYKNCEIEIDFFKFDIPAQMNKHVASTLSLLFAWSLHFDNITDVTRISTVEKTYKNENTSFVSPFIKMQTTKELNVCQIQSYVTGLKSIYWKAEIRLPNGQTEIVKVTDIQSKEVNEKLIKSVFAGVAYPFHDAEKMTRDGIITNNIHLSGSCSSVSIEASFQDDNMTILNITSFRCTKANLHHINISGNIISIAITFASFSISIIALTVNFIVITRLKMTNTIPGTNMRNLTISMIMAEAVFIFGIGASFQFNVCYSVGIILHYLWLNVFIFMTIAVLWISRHLFALKPRTGHNSSDSTFARWGLTIVGIIVPTFLVTPAVVLDHYNVIPMNYNERACFPTNMHGNLYFFTGPVIFLLLVNVICVTAIIIKLAKTKSDIKLLFAGRQTSFDVKVYIRLVAISLTVWSLGIINMIVKNEELDFIFSLLCGLHGTFIAIANMSTRSVLEHLRS